MAQAIRPARVSKSIAIRNLGIEEEWEDDGADESAHDSDEDLAENASEGDETLIEYDTSEEETEEDENLQTQMVSKDGTEWSHEPTGSKHQTPSRNIVRQRQGFKQTFSEIGTPSECFSHIMTDDMLQQILRWTNQRIERERAAVARVDMVELKAFIGILYFTAIWKSNGESLEELWDNNTGRAVFRATMTLHRFKELLRFPRFDNADTRLERQQDDKFAPIRDVWQMFNTRLKDIYTNLQHSSLLMSSLSAFGADVASDSIPHQSR